MFVQIMKLLFWCTHNHVRNEQLKPKKLIKKNISIIKYRSPIKYVMKAYDEFTCLVVADGIPLPFGSPQRTTNVNFFLVNNLICSIPFDFNKSNSTFMDVSYVSSMN